ncbi:hypothetical protein F5B20DRAFT_577291 [Whalleya microplaca]|nr:hypothetical protein F5B20DRAFT_577291 [Whalleya microplaca]
MQSYCVTIVPRGAGVVTRNPVVLLVPFSSEGIVLEFIDNLWDRLARQNLLLSADSHTIVLHRDSEIGPIIDFEDVLSDIIINPRNERLFAVVTEKVNVATSRKLQEKYKIEEGVISLRIITPDSANKKETCPILNIPSSASIGQLHRHINEHLGITSTFEEHVETYECNCILGSKIASDPSETTHFLVIHGKSRVERILLQRGTKDALKETLLGNFGYNLETRKEINFLGAKFDPTDNNVYEKTPVVTICSKERHTPIHSRINVEDDTDKQKSMVVDLHTSEIPIHPSCFSSTLQEAGLQRLMVEDAIDIYAVHRATADDTPALVGKSSIFRSRAPWEPKVVQSDRGMAMFLSSLRVFTSIVQDKEDDKRYQDAILHVFDLFTRFPPALRSLHMLIEGKTLAAAESAALSHAVFEVLNSFVPLAISGFDTSRVFEGARLFFGFVLEMAKALKLPAENDSDADALPYISALHTVDIRDHMTGEGVMHAFDTPNGLVEANLFDAFKMAAPLAESHLQTFMVKKYINPDTARYALLSGGTTREISVSFIKLASCYRYKDSENINTAIDLDQLSDLGRLAELCSQTKLSVYRSNQLTSAVTPCLTFDRNAHLAVYTGEEPCGNPGKSSLVFRPKYGEETIDPGVIEQLIVNILERYQAEGTAAFDALGCAEVRKLLTPDEVLMFCVDCSSSMSHTANFSEIDDDNIANAEEGDNPEEGEALVEPRFYSRASVEDVKEDLANNESFDDMTAIIAKTAESHRSQAAEKVLHTLRLVLSSEITLKSKSLGKKRESAHTFYYLRREIPELETELEKLKSFWAGLKTHEEHIKDFLRYRATYPSRGIEQNWTWSFGDRIPGSTMSQHTLNIPDDVTRMPEHLQCPISYTLMDDAVTAVDGHTYSRRSIEQWYTIRKSSPMHGLGIHDTSLIVNQDIRDAVARWVNGDGFCRQGAYPGYITVTFDSRVSSFQRCIRPYISLEDLHKVAFRGLKARFPVFQLWTETTGPLQPCSSLALSSLHRIRNGDHITIRIVDDTPVPSIILSPSRKNSYEMCLIKVYGGNYEMLFSYWVKRDTIKSLASVVWKYWRYQLGKNPNCSLSPVQVYTRVQSMGDGFFYGCSRESVDKLATYLTQDNCWGRLAPENLFHKDIGVYDNSSSDDRQEPMVLKVFIRKRDNKCVNRGLTRLDALKQMFEALINRMLAYNYKTHVGLVSFSSQSQVAMPISHVLENFRRATVDMGANGDTALWDALALASDQVEEYAANYPGVKKRIICISDGKDTHSKVNTSHSVCWSLLHTNTIVDSVCLGVEDNQDLRTLSYLLGSYRFHPQSLVNAMAICEMEPFLSLTERPAIELPESIPKHALKFRGSFIQARARASATVVSDDVFPPRREHPNLHDNFFQLTAAIAQRHNNRKRLSSVRTNLRTSRLMREMQAVVVYGTHPVYDIYVSESDISFWKIVMEGPEGSPYSEGTFLFYLHADDDYPACAPKARFVTKIKHPNINTHGRICHSIFNRDWTSDIGMGMLLETVYGLLCRPEYSDPVNTMTTLGFHHDEVGFADEVREHVRKHALQTREEWKTELLEKGRAGRSDEFR